MTDNFGRTTAALVTCDKGGHHQAEGITIVCLNPLCREDCLCCQVCKTTYHQGHSLFSLQALLSDVEFKTKRLEKKSELVQLGEIEDATSACLGAVKNISRYVNAKLQKLENKMIAYYSVTKNEIQSTMKAKCNWSYEMEKLRFENDKQRLKDKVIDILGNVTLGDGKVQKINEEFFGAKSNEQVQAFKQSFIETLKNIQQGVSYQYQKMYNPLVQPQHLRKDYFQSQSTQSSKASSLMQSTNQQFQDGYNPNYDVISFSSKGINNPSSSSSRYQQSLQSSSQQPQNHYSQNSLQLNQDQIDKIPKYLQKSQEQSLYSSSVASSQAPNLTSIQQASEQLKKQIEQQQEILFQLQNSQQLQQSQQVSQSFQPQTFVRHPSFSEESKSSFSRINSASPPQRLMYYSSLFQQHLQQKQIPQVSHSQTRSNSKFQPSQATDSSFYLHNNSFSGSPLQNVQEQNSQTSEQKPNFGGLISNDLEQEFEPSDFENKKFKDLPKSSERSIKFSFSKEYKHASIELVEGQRKIRGGGDAEESRLALALPSVETKPIKEFHWIFKILNCKSMAYSSPLAVGICLKKLNEKVNYKFQGEDTTSIKGTNFSRSSLKNATSISSFKDMQTTNSSKIEESHGCYLLTSSGFIRNHSDPNQDMKRVSVRFNQGDTLLCHFNPFRKYLKIKNKTSGEFCMINIEFRTGDQLFPCVRLSYCQDLVEISEDDE